jgi:hypothetical protein
MELRYYVRKLLLAAGAVLLFALPSLAQVSPIPFIKPTWTNQSGQPCSGCMLGTFQAGTSTPLVTYSDAAGTIPNSNPVILDAYGRANVFLGSSAYKFVLQSPGGVTYWTEDNITATSLSLLASNNVWTGTNTWQSTSTFNGPVTMTVGFTSSGPNVLGGGGSMSGSWSGSPTFTGNPNFTGTPQFANASFTGQIFDSVTGVPPFVVNSNLEVANLNANLLENCDWASPCAIGGTAPNTAIFTTLRANTSFNINGSTNQVGIQGTDTHLLTAGTVASGAAHGLCTDANGGATTTGCATSGFSQIESMILTGASICTTGSGAETTCNMGPFTWPTAFVDSSYALTCSTPRPTSGATNPGIYPIYFSGKSASGFSLIMQNGSASAAGTNTVSEIDCIAVHP